MQSRLDQGRPVSTLQAMPSVARPLARKVISAACAAFNSSARFWGQILFLARLSSFGGGCGEGSTLGEPTQCGEMSSIEDIVARNKV
jgi:hypothetical protein